MSEVIKPAHTMKILVILSAILVGVYGGVLAPHMLRDGKIVGGVSAQIDEVPYQVALLQTFYSSFFFTCGGSIISASTVLTAAHCTSGIAVANWRVRAGSTFQNVGGQFIQPNQIIQHPSFSYRNMVNDIALMVLSTPLVLGPQVAIVSLPSLGQTVADNTMALVSGWGYLNEGSTPAPSQLYKVSLPIMNQTVCYNLYKTFNPVTSNMICAGYAAGMQDACQGDSGGPLVVNNIQYGITSWGRGCARPNSPGVYTRVSMYANWIVISRILHEKLYQENVLPEENLPEEILRQFD